MGLSQSNLLVPLWPDKEKSPGVVWDDRPVLILFDALGSAMRGQVLDLSPTRAHIRPDDPFLLCNKTAANLKFRYADIVYSMTGTAVAGCSGTSFHLDFDEITRKDMALLRALGIAAAAEKQMAAAAAHAAAQAQKRCGPRSRAEQRKVLHLPPPHGVERRMNPRLEMETTVQLTILETGKKLVSTMLDISMSGCRLYSDIPFHLIDHSRAEVEFIAHGHPFRLAAEIRVKEEEHLLGLRFLNMSCRFQDRLYELMGELAEMIAAR